MKKNIALGGALFALAVAAAAFAQSGGPLDTFTFSTGKKCTLVGSASSEAGKNLNRLKNRYQKPLSSQIKQNITMKALLKPGDDWERFSPLSAARLEGLVVAVKMGGNETCNCKEEKTVDRDTHIELALSPNAPKNQRVIVEVTPRMRFLMKQQNIDWTTETLRGTGPKGIKGKWVRVTGWMLFDTMHINEAENTNPGDSSNWRATGWELHPVTSIKVIPQPPPLNSPSGNVTFSPALLSGANRSRREEFTVRERTLLRQRNAALISKFPVTERDKDNEAN